MTIRHRATARNARNAAFRAPTGNAIADDFDALLAARDAEFAALDAEEALLAMGIEKAMRAA